MDSSSFQELSERFTDKLSGLREAVSLQLCAEGAREEESGEMAETMESLWQQVEELTDILTLIRNQRDQQRTVLNQVQDLKVKLRSLTKSVHHTSSNIPPHLPACNPAPAASDSAPAQDANSLTQTTEPPAQLPPSSTARVQAPANNLPSQVAPGNKTNNSGASKSQAPPCPPIDYLTVDEFQDVPKYMKGRMSYQQTNSTIDELNKAFTAKYKLLRQKKSTLNDIHRKRYETLKRQENQDTSGVYFVVDQDLKEWSGLKLSRETLSIFTLLRHCGRLREIRGEGVTRYAMVESY